MQKGFSVGILKIRNVTFIIIGENEIFQSILISCRIDFWYIKH